jgi:hypothetical protein
MKYDILTDNTITGLIYQVNKSFREDWKPLGSTWQTAGHVFCQTIILDDDDGLF